MMTGEEEMQSPLLDNELTNQVIYVILGGKPWQATLRRQRKPIHDRLIKSIM